VSGKTSPEGVTGTEHFSQLNSEPGVRDGPLLPLVVWRSMPQSPQVSRGAGGAGRRYSTLRPARPGQSVSMVCASGPRRPGSGLVAQDDDQPRLAALKHGIEQAAVKLRDALGQPPIGALLAALAIRTIRLLAEQDLGKRLAMREQIQAYLVETWGE
jgi:hypothetical protein